MKVALRILLIGSLAFAAAAPAWAQKKPDTDFNPNRPLPKPKPKPAPTPAPAANLTKADSLAMKAKIELPLQLKEPSADGSTLTLPYALPYGGVVELRLYQGDTTGTLVFQENYIQKPGDNRIRLKQKAFKPGQSYLAVITFKGKRYLQPISL